MGTKHCHLPITDSTSSPLQSLLERCICLCSRERNSVDYPVSSVTCAQSHTHHNSRLCAGEQVNLKIQGKFLSSVFAAQSGSSGVYQSSPDSDDFRQSCNSQARDKSLCSPPDRYEGNLHNPWGEAGWTLRSCCLL